MFNKEYTSIFKGIKGRLMNIMVRISKYLGQMFIEFGEWNHSTSSFPDYTTPVATDPRKRNSG